jgi:hypothetical protein
MNVWKPIAIVATAGLVASLGYRNAQATPPDPVHPTPMGVCHDQPNMVAALTSLKAAKASLEKAEHNKGGWRVAAIEATTKAIAETDRGCAFADK